MAYNILTGRRTKTDLSLSISGDDDDNGSWWNPVSWVFSSSDKPPSKDEEALKEAKKKEKEAEKKVKDAAVQLKLDKDADALERKTAAAKAKAEKHKSQSSGIGLSYDELGNAQIFDVNQGDSEMPKNSALDFIFGDFVSDGEARDRSIEDNGDSSGWERGRRFGGQQQQFSQPGQQGRGRHHHHRRPGQVPGQIPGQPYGAQPYGAPTPYGTNPYGTSSSTTWPPPAPTTLPPGSPWPPPGATPGSDLSSYYPPGQAPMSALPASSPYAALYAQQYPQPLPNGQMPMMPGTNMPYPSPTIDVTVGGRGGVGLKFDAMGRATIVDLPRQRRR